MKKFLGYFAVFSTAIMLFSFNSSFKGEVPIGTIIHSLMPPDYFRANNPDWVLLDGSELKKDSRLSQALLATTLRMESLPDARGMFLRGSNFGGGADKDSTRKIGQRQENATKLPNNQMTSTGLAKDSLSEHTHEIEKRNHSTSLSSYNNNGSVNQRRNKDHLAVLTPMSLERKKHYIKTPNLKHGHFVKSIVDGGGDNETRPVNLNFYIYIKVK